MSDVNKKRELPPIPVEVYEHVHVCGLCGYIHESWRRFMRHIIYHHRISYKQYVVQTRYGNVWPLCSCGCGANAYVGISLRRIGQPVYASECWRRMRSERAVQVRTDRSRAATIRRVIVAHPLWRREETSLQRAKLELEITHALRASGELDIDSAMFYETMLKTRIDRLETDVAKTEKRLKAALEHANKKTSKRSRSKKKDQDPVDLVPSHIVLGLDEVELWRIAERAAKTRS